MARPSAYRAAFAASAGTEGAAEAEQDGATLHYPDGRFEVRFGRMPMLAALM